MGLNLSEELQSSITGYFGSPNSEEAYLRLASVVSKEYRYSGSGNFKATFAHAMFGVDSPCEFDSDFQSWLYLSLIDSRLRSAILKNCLAAEHQAVSPTETQFKIWSVIKQFTKFEYSQKTRYQSRADAYSVTHPLGRHCTGATVFESHTEGGTSYMLGHQSVASLGQSDNAVRYFCFSDMSATDEEDQKDTYYMFHSVRGFLSANFAAILGELLDGESLEYANTKHNVARSRIYSLREKLKELSDSPDVKELVNHLYRTSNPRLRSNETGAH